MKFQTENQLPVLILRHPSEERQGLGSAALLEKTLSNVTVRTGLSWRSFSGALGRAESTSGWAVLFPGSKLPHHYFRSKEDRLLRLDPTTKEYQSLESSDIENIKGIVILDGNWKQSKLLWWRNPWLLKLRRLAVVPAARSRLNPVIRTPRREYLTTIECVRTTLSLTGESPEVLDALDRTIEAWAKEQKPLPPRKNRRHRREARNAERLRPGITTSKAPERELLSSQVTLDQAKA